MTRDGLTAHFSKAGQLEVTHNGKVVFSYDPGQTQPKLNSPAKPRVRAPAVLWHRINGRLTDKDIATTICDTKDNPIGIYTGFWVPEWAKGSKIRTYAAITDARDENGYRLYLNFNKYVKYLGNHPNGESLLDRPSDKPDITYEMALQTTIIGMKPGERTGQMIPTYELLSGQKYSGQPITHSNNMHDLRHTGDFTKADNGGYDSRFVTETGSSDQHWYMSSTEALDSRASIYGTDFTDDGGVWIHKDSGNWSLRPFIAEIALK